MDKIPHGNCFYVHWWYIIKMFLKVPVYETLAQLWQLQVVYSLEPSSISRKDANLNRQCGIETRCVCSKRASTYGLLEQKKNASGRSASLKGYINKSKSYYIVCQVFSSIAQVYRACIWIEICFCLMWTLMLFFSFNKKSCTWPHYSLRASRENKVAKTELFELDEGRIVWGEISTKDHFDSRQRGLDRTQPWEKW